MIIDTHCHLVDEAYGSEHDEIIHNAITAGVTRMILACCDNSEYLPIKSLCALYPNNLFPTLGIHPENMAEDIMSQLDVFEKILCFEKKSIVAIGEIGLDLFWDKSRLEDQKTVLLRQLELAMQMKLPVLLHIRDAMPEFLDLLYYLKGRSSNELCQSTDSRIYNLKGILHCYSGTIDQAEEAMKLGDFLLGVGGTVTYKKSDRIEVVKHFGLDKIVLETDAPYLSPIPHRGKRNEPAYVAEVARFVSDKLDIPLEEVCEKTTKNAEMLFGFN